MSSKQDDDSPTLTVDETARLIRKGKNQVYELVRTGEIEAIRFGKTIRILRKPLMRRLNGEGGGKAA